MAKPSIILLTQSGNRFELNHTEHPTLLEALEAQKLAVEYQCREGYCGSCRVRLQKGAVCYNSPPLAYLNPGEILPCCCLPDGDIEIDL